MKIIENVMKRKTFLKTIRIRTTHCKEQKQHKWKRNNNIR